MLRIAAADVKREMASERPSLDTFAAVLKVPMRLVTEGELLRVTVADMTSGISSQCR